VAVGAAAVEALAAAAEAALVVAGVALVAALAALVAAVAAALLVAAVAAGVATEEVAGFSRAPGAAEASPRHRPRAMASAATFPGRLATSSLAGGRAGTRS
jgi:hypothetical protein